MTVLTACGIPYFDDLPRYALPALQSAWDKIRINEFGNKLVFTSFCRDMKQLGQKEPSQPVMTSWIHAVQSGDIPRPLSGGESATAIEDAGEANPVVTCLQADVAGSSDDASDVVSEPAAKPQTPVVKGKSESEARLQEVIEPVLPIPTPFQPLTPADFKASVVTEETPEIVLQGLTARMVDEEEAKLRLYVRDQARKIVAGRLRTMLEQLGALDA